MALKVFASGHFSFSRLTTMGMRAWALVWPCSSMSFWASRSSFGDGLGNWAPDQRREQQRARDQWAGRGSGKLGARTEAVEVADEEPLGGGGAADFFYRNTAGRFVVKKRRSAGRAARGQPQSAAAAEAKLGESVGAHLPVGGSEEAGGG